MNSDAPKSLREELEARLCALLLGELPADEAALLREILAHDAELAKLHDRLKQTIDLVRETARSEVDTATQEVLQLSEERRRRLTAAFLIPPFQPEGVKPSPGGGGSRLIGLLAVLAIIALLSAMLLPALSKAKSKAQSVAVMNNLRQLDSAKQQWALENNKSPEDSPTFDDIRTYFKGEFPSVKGEKYVLGKVGEPVSAEVAAADAKKAFGRYPASPASASREGRVRLSSDGRLSAVNETALASPAPAAARPDAKQLAFRTWGLEDAEPASKIEAPKSASYGLNVTPQTPPPVAAMPVESPKLAQIVLPKARAADAVVTVATPLAIDPSTGLPTTPLSYDSPVEAGAALTPLSPPTEEATATFRARYGMPVRAEVANQGAVLVPSAGSGSVAERPLKSEATSTAEPSWALDSSSLGAEPKRAGAFAFKAGTAVAGAGVGGGGGGASGGDLVVAQDFTRTATTAAEAATTHFYSDTDPQSRGQRRVGDKVVDRSDTVPATPPVEIKARFAETTQNDKQALGFDWYLGRAQAAGGTEPALRGQERAGSRVPQELLRGSVTTTSGRQSGEVPVLGDVPVLGQTFTNASVRGFYDNGLVSAGGRIAAEPEVYSANVTNATQLASIRAYDDKKRDLEEMVDLQRLIIRKMNVEDIDAGLPKSAQVEIVESAQPVTPKKPSMWHRLAGESAPVASSVAKIKIERDKSDIEDVADSAGSDSSKFNPYDPHFLQTESELITSEAVLGKTVDLLAKDGRAINEAKRTEAIAELRKRIEVQPVKNTSVMEIRANGNTPEETTKLAQAVSEAYRRWKHEQGAELAMGALRSLKEKSNEQEEKIRIVKQELAQLQQNLGIVDGDTSGRQSETSKKIDADLPIRKPSTNAPIPQPEVLTSENAFSTFSLNVSDVAFKLAAASLEQGQMPDSASVRSEEFINAFDYRDPEPKADAPIAFAWERARYPFAHNRDLLRFSLKTAAEGRQAGRPLNLVLLLDSSGSMERVDRVRIIREALRVLAGQLQPQDKLSVISFARTARLVADGIPGSQAGAVVEQVSGLTPQGGTNLEEAMRLAYQTAARHYLAAGINRVVLLTDGAANLGDVAPDSLKQQVETQRRQGIALDCFGIGWEGFNDDLLEVLSRNGDGRYGFINSPEEAATEFAGQLAGALKVAASDVKVQVEFNTNRVTAYRQIGYAKHQLKKEQFRDNTVDAAEIAAQEAGNALYTVEVNPTGSGPLGTVRVRYKVPGTTDYREQAWDVPYTGYALSVEQSSPAMRLAASAAAFSEWLVASPFAAEVTPDRVLGLLNGVPEVFGADSRPKKLEWMIRQAKSLEGK